MCMNNLNELKDNEIIDLIPNGKVKAKDLTDSGICQTCFDKEHNFVLYGDNHNKLIYEDEFFEIMFVPNPRSVGHTIISTKRHYKDMMELPDELIIKVFLLAKKTMKAIKNVYGCESVYLCTMCDGPMNHFHLQLIPRYSYEKRGSINFVKERKEYIENKEKIALLKKIMNSEN